MHVAWHCWGCHPFAAKMCRQRSSFPVSHSSCSGSSGAHSHFARGLMLAFSRAGHPTGYGMAWGLFTDMLLCKCWWRPRTLTFAHIWAAPDSVNRPNPRYLCWSIEPFWKKFIYLPSSPRQSHTYDGTGAAKTRSCALMCTLPTIFQLLCAQSPSSAGLSFVYVFDCSPVCDWRRRQGQGQLLSAGFSQCVVHTEPPP